MTVTHLQRVMLLRILARHPKPLTIRALVRDRSFDPDDYRPLVPTYRTDRKPWPNSSKYKYQRPAIRRESRCEVCDGSPYTPPPLNPTDLRVCGYCRGLVRGLRECESESSNQPAEGRSA